MKAHDANVIRPSWRLHNARWLFWVCNDTSRKVPHLRWWWRAIGQNGATWEGDEYFTTLLACQLDAATHGFEPLRSIKN